MESLINIGLYFTYFLFIIAAVAAIAFPLFEIIKNPLDAKVTLMGVAGIVCIFLAGYFLSPGDVILDATGAVLADVTLSKLVGAGLTTLYLLFAVAIISILYTEVSKLFTK